MANSALDIKWGDVGKGAAIAAPLIGTWWSARSAAKEAEKNRRFQADQSSTAHQREVKDLLAAGINPALRGLSGADSGSGSQADTPDWSEGVMKAIAVRQANANIRFTKAQTVAALETAAETRMRAKSIGEGGQIFQQRAIDLQLAQMSLAERRNLFAPAIAAVWAEIDQIHSASRANKARAALDEFASRGAQNAAEVDELISRFPEWARFFGGVLGKLGAGAVGGAAAGALLRRPTKVYNFRR